jgi:hypothetical protein
MRQLHSRPVRCRQALANLVTYLIGMTSFLTSRRERASARIVHGLIARL